VPLVSSPAWKAIVLAAGHDLAEVPPAARPIPWIDHFSDRTRRNGVTIKKHADNAQPPVPTWFGIKPVVLSRNDAAAPSDIDVLWFMLVHGKDIGGRRSLMDQFAAFIETQPLAASPTSGARSC
jgi:hypothetical protein